MKHLKTLSITIVTFSLLGVSMPSQASRGHREKMNQPSTRLDTRFGKRLSNRSNTRHENNVCRLARFHSQKARRLQEIEEQIFFNLYWEQASYNSRPSRSKISKIRRLQQKISFNQWEAKRYRRACRKQHFQRVSYMQYGSTF